MQTFVKNTLASLALCAFWASLAPAAAAKSHAPSAHAVKASSGVTRERSAPLPPAALVTRRDIRVRVHPLLPTSAEARRDVRDSDGQVTATLTDLTRTTATFRRPDGETHTYRISDADYERLSSEIGQEVTYAVESGDRIVLNAIR